MARVAKKRANIKRDITAGSLALRAVMTENFETIAQAMIDQIMVRLAKLPESQRLTAINDLKKTGVAEYKAAMLASMSVVAFDSLEAVRKEVPAAKSVKLMENEESLLLGEFEELPASIRAKVFKQYQLLSLTQLDDLQKEILFQFNHSIDSTDSLDLIRKDLEDTAFEFTSGPRVQTGAASMAAQVINETRNSFFDDPEVQDEIDAFEFVNEDPVSPICQDLAGRIFEKDDPDRFRYTPPLHFNCKSWMRPILKGNLKGREITGLTPSTKKIEDSIQFADAVCGCGDIHLEIPK